MYFCVFSQFLAVATGLLRVEKTSNFLYVKTTENTTFPVVFGGDKRDRTADLLNAIQALSQLSYTPIFGFSCVPFKERWYYSTAGVQLQVFFSKNGEIF